MNDHLRGNKWRNACEEENYRVFLFNGGFTVLGAQVLRVLFAGESNRMISTVFFVIHCLLRAGSDEPPQPNLIVSTRTTC